MSRRNNKGQAATLLEESVGSRSDGRFVAQGGARNGPTAKPGRQVSSLAQIHTRGNHLSHPDDTLWGEAEVNDAVWRNGRVWVVQSIKGRVFELRTLKTPLETIQVNV